MSEEERGELERIARSETRPFREVQRARMILYSAAGETDGWIAERLDCTPECVGKWRRRFGAARIEGLTDLKRAGRPRRFPPEQVAEVKAIACELPGAQGLPLSRFTRTELHRLVIERGVTDASATTIWRWLHDAAIKPWQVRSWLFARDPDFARKAARVLDLYQRRFEGRRLRPDEYVISADEKSQLQALGRRHPTLPPAPGRPSLCEFEYRRGGTLAYLAGWDVHHANLFGRVEEKTGIEPFGRLVEEVMTSEPYASARRVFWIVDNGSSHAGQGSIERLEGAYENLRLIHLPIHASWLNQIELWFSIVQRKALTPNDFGSLGELSDRLLAFQARYAEIARPFEWTFTRSDLERVLARIADREPELRLAA